VRALTAVVALVLSCAACAVSTVPGSGGAGSSGTSISGSRAMTDLHVTVMQAPTCPVERMDSPCPPAPVPSARITVLRDGTVVTRADTDGHGNCVVRVAPGHYVVQAAHASALPNPAHKDVDVGATAVSVTIVLDSGIR
jgi:hypothetical protein